MTFSISLSICTMDRPDVLDRCLASIAAGSAFPDDVCVSDDSTNPDATRIVCAKYPFVTYLAGPRRGLCANRNGILRAVQTSHVSLLDDDGTVEPDFIEKLRTLLPALQQRTIVTGDVLEYGRRTRPMNPTFWGHFEAEPRRELRTINLNCNLFPLAAFRYASFDENIVYGYEDMDLCACLLSKGFHVRYEPKLVNRHLPPHKTETETRRRFRLVQQARFQVTLKRYVLWERNLLKAAAFCVLAPLHRAAHAIKRRYWNDIPRAGADIVMALMITLRARASMGPTKPPTRMTSSRFAWLARSHSRGRFPSPGGPNGTWIPITDTD